MELVTVEHIAGQLLLTDRSADDQHDRLAQRLRGD
jgi:hypothetical protein